MKHIRESERSHSGIIKKGKDFVQGIDDLPVRKVIDENKNNNGTSHLKYLNKLRCVY